MKGSAGLSNWWFECVAEGLKVATVRRNLVLVVVAVTVSCATPWLFVAGFSALRADIRATSIEVVALAQRNQTVAFALMVVLGLQAYLSDAANGLMASRLALGRNRAVPGGKFLFGALSSVLLALGCSASAVLACFALRFPGFNDGALGAWEFWLVSSLGLAAALLLYFEIGLLCALVARHKGLGLAAGLMVPFVLLPILRNGLRSLSPSLASAVDWVMPTELASWLVAWVPGGNSLMGSSPEGLAERAALVGCWLVAAAAVWIAVYRRRPFYPSDSG